MITSLTAPHVPLTVWLPLLAMTSIAVRLAPTVREFGRDFGPIGRWLAPIIATTIAIWIYGALLRLAFSLIHISLPIWLAHLMGAVILVALSNDYSWSKFKRTIGGKY